MNANLIIHDVQNILIIRQPDDGEWVLASNRDGTPIYLRRNGNQLFLEAYGRWSKAVAQVGDAELMPGVTRIVEEFLGSLVVTGYKGMQW